MTVIRNVEDLRVYEISLELLKKLYEVAYRIPHIKLRTQSLEKFFLKPIN